MSHTEVDDAFLGLEGWEIEKEETPRGASSLSPLERNPLLYPPHFESANAMEGFRQVVEDLIERLGGEPVTIEVSQVKDYWGEKNYPRLVAKFKPEAITVKQLAQLQDIAKRMSPAKVRTLKAYGGDMEGSYTYPKIDAAGRSGSRDKSKIGWYFGSESGTPGRLHEGMLVFRKISNQSVASGIKARRDAEWFTEPNLMDNTGRVVSTSYEVEIREESMYQIDLAEEIVLTSLVLAGKQLPEDKAGFLYDIYHEMTRIGLRENIELPGLAEHIAEIEEALILSLASPNLARSLKAKSRAITLIGQVGTGKTQAINYVLNEDLGVVMVPVNSLELESDLQQPEHKRYILPRIKYMSERMGRQVVMVVEDIERLAREENPVSSTLLNELAGLFESGYRILCTTNHPEQFNPQLLETERLGGRLIFFGLPNENARRYILEAHTPAISGELGLELFDPELLGIDTGVHFDNGEQARDYVLSALAKATDGFTPRYLQDIVNRAKTALMLRVARKAGRMDQLKEEDLVGISFTLEDWEKAYAGVVSSYDRQERLNEDRRLEKFVHPGNNTQTKVGFKINDNHAKEVNIFANGKK